MWGVPELASHLSGYIGPVGADVYVLLAVVGCCSTSFRHPDTSPGSLAGAGNEVSGCQPGERMKALAPVLALDLGIRGLSGPVRGPQRSKPKPLM